MSIVSNYPVGIYLFKVNNGDSRTMLNLFKVKNRNTVNSEQISHIILMLFCYFEQVSVGWEDVDVCTKMILVSCVSLWNIDANGD